MAAWEFHMVEQIMLALDGDELWKTVHEMRGAIREHSLLSTLTLVFAGRDPLLGLGLTSLDERRKRMLAMLGDSARERESNDLTGPALDFEEPKG